jgi:cell division protein FtsN
MSNHNSQSKSAKAASQKALMLMAGSIVVGIITGVVLSR